MRRFVEYRWLAPILICSFLLAGGASWSSRACAEGVDVQVVSDGDSGGGGGGSEGDPDGPSGPTRGQSWTGGDPRASSGAVKPAVGDGGSALRVWMWRLQVLLQSMKIRAGRF